MSDEVKDLICLLLFVSIGFGFMILFFISIKDAKKPAKEVEVHNVPFIHSNSNGTMDMYLFPIVD
jgi:hypothetical protein